MHDGFMYLYNTLKIEGLTVKFACDTEDLLSHLIRNKDAIYVGLEY